MGQFVTVNPFRCRLWALHDRLEETINEETCKAEIDSFERIGQVVPALGRPVRGDPMFDAEIVCGARRLFVARHLKKALLVELRDLSDREATIAMDIENHERKEISAYELGLCYTTWLRDGVFGSQEEIARTLRRSPSQICRYIKVAHLPAVVVAAFATPLDICETWGVSLAEAWADSARRATMAKAARDLAATSPRVAPAEVYETLIGIPVRGRTHRRQVHDEVVKDECGTPLFRIAKRRRWVCLLVPAEAASSGVLSELRSNVKRVLQVARGEAMPKKATLGALLHAGNGIRADGPQEWDTDPDGAISLEARESASL